MIMSVAIILNLAIIFSVMLPSTFMFYTDPDVVVLEPLSITTLLHSVVGLPAIVSGMIYAFGDLPTKRKKWMRITAVLWVGNIAIGIFMFLQMMHLI